MKNLSKIVEAKQKISKINVGDNTINFIEANDLKKYLELGDKVLSPNSKYVIQYLIDNNKTYLSELNSDEDNVLAGFFNAGREKASNKDLWDNISEIVKNGNYKEIPVFFTKKQFDEILSKKRPIEYYILELDTDKGRNKVATKYQPLVMKIAHQFDNKSNLPFEDLVQEGNKGLNYAMEHYGAPKRITKDADGNDKDVTKLSFGQYAAWQIRNAILDAIKELSHLVKIPVSQQRKEKAVTGRNTKNYTVSGDKTVGVSSDGNKSLFDFLGQADNSVNSLDQEDIKKFWDQAFDIIEQNFDKKTMEIFYSVKGLKDHEKISKKDLAKKYGCVPSQITYFCNKVIQFILTNKKVKKLLANVYELMHECQSEIDQNDNEGPYYINIEENLSINDEY